MNQLSGMLRRNSVLILVTALIAVFSVPQAFAGSESIRAGVWQVGGSASGGFDSANGLDLAIYPSARYFVTGRIAVGALLRYHTTDLRTRVGAGPTAEYYFWKSGPWASYVGQNVMFSRTRVSGGGSDSDTAATSSLGVNYFFARRTALGLSLNFTYFENDSGDTLQSGSIRGNFAFFF